MKRIAPVPEGVAHRDRPVNSRASTKLIAGNWKMNGLVASLHELDTMIEESMDGATGAEMLICPPFTLIHSFVEAAAGSRVMIGAQDCHTLTFGPHTGNISAEMIADVGATHIIVGHSERRTDHDESDEIVRAKAEAVMRAGLVAILCVGETGEERDGGKALNVIRRQMQDSVPDGADARRLIVAYEPVWAIGTGRVPDDSDIRTVHAAIREALRARFGKAGSTIRILYGGSVKASNAARIMTIENVDGALVGGASLRAKDFLEIAEAV